MKTGFRIDCFWVFLLLLVCAVSVLACSCPPCSNCYRQAGSYPNCSCVWDCAAGETCCNGACCYNSCCGGSICYNSNNNKCCNDNGHYLCPKGKTCCKGSCCGPDESCCGSTCYDPSEQKCCSDTLLGSKYICNINETCCRGHCCPEGQACCHTSYTGGTCYNTTTQKCCPGVSGGYDYICNINEKCCDDGSCAAPCEETDNDTACSSEHDTPCIACAGLSHDCSDYRKKVYSGNTLHYCTGGCPGSPPDPPDCYYEDPMPVCYDTYLCSDFIYYRWAKCTTYPQDPGDIQPPETGPLECYGRDYPWGCTRCQDGSFDNHWYIVSKTCQ